MKYEHLKISFNAKSKRAELAKEVILLVASVCLSICLCVYYRDKNLVSAESQKPLDGFSRNLKRRLSRPLVVLHVFK